MSGFNFIMWTKEKHRKSCAKYYQKNKEKLAAKQKKYYDDNRDIIVEKRRIYIKKTKEKRQLYHQGRKKERRAYSLKHTYGITIEDYNKMFSDQSGCCKICGIHENKLNKILHVDHCHKSGRIRGLLCTKCNSVLALCDDNVQVLSEAINYLKISHNELQAALTM